MNPSPNKLLSEYLNAVGDEQAAKVVIDGEVRTVSRAEAVARTLFQQATGGMVDVLDSKTGEIVQVYIKPVVSAAKIIREFTEGKAAAGAVTGGGASKKAGRYGADSRKRLTEILNQEDPPSTAPKLKRPTPPHK